MRRLWWFLRERRPVTTGYVVVSVAVVVLVHELT